MTTDVEDEKPIADEDAGYAADNTPDPVSDESDEDVDIDPIVDDPEPPAPDWEARFKALEQQIAETRAAPPPAPAPIPVSPDDAIWKGLKDDYPDIAEPIKKLLDRQHEQFGQALAEVQAKGFEEAMDAARSDWRDLRNDKAFGAWLQANPAQQQAAQQPGVRSAMAVIKAYDAHKDAQVVQEKRQTRLKAAEAAPTKGSRAPNLSDALDGWAAP